ncbi:hypothetical protein Cob_v011818 [Colletotrichum orbiculare MAFF 240422]|uniref:Uncharacterized protein n=1 Tax=Colletotrichum orbiculare (strain 104-T / ATCC 96160 / CBS 514.97 / LARS 414 / MAFF 240422) TaxID=1213857 RepID=N4UZU9_COLOR|nr:hypothetical protein Cob_v011818 [Colletotrichum orbiculare MAFF 240422]
MLFYWAVLPLLLSLVSCLPQSSINEASRQTVPKGGKYDYKSIQAIKRLQSRAGAATPTLSSLGLAARAWDGNWVVQDQSGFILYAKIADDDLTMHVYKMENPSPRRVKMRSAIAALWEDKSSYYLRSLLHIKYHSITNQQTLAAMKRAWDLGDCGGASECRIVWNEDVPFDVLRDSPFGQGASKMIAEFSGMARHYISSFDMSRTGLDFNAGPDHPWLEINFRRYDDQ